MLLLNTHKYFMERITFRPKTTEKLKNQMDFVSQTIGESIAPPSKAQSVFTQLVDSLKQQYPRRFGIYVAVLSNSEIPIKDSRKIKLLNNLDAYIFSHNQNVGAQVLRGRQMGVFEDIREAIEHGEDEGTISAPTGLGKTVIFNQLVAAVDAPTLIVVPTQRLVEQTYEQFRRFTPNLEVGRVYNRRKEYGKQVTITTYSSLTLDNEGKLINPDGIEVVVLDEAHEGTSEKRINKIQAVEAFKDAVILGFSATPVEIQDPRFSNTRVGRMTRNLVHEISEREAVEEGYLSPFSAILVEVGVDITEVRVTEGGDYDESEIEKRINTVTQNRAAVEFFLKARQRDREQQAEAGIQEPLPLITSLYATSVAHAQELVQEFERAGVKAAAVWGTQNDREQDKILELWQKGEIEVVCSKDLLVRGIDIADIRMVMNVAPTCSEIVEKQRCGRSLRLDPNNLDKLAIIADFVYTNSNKRRPQITYPQVIGASQLVRSSVESVGSIHRAINIPLPEIQIDGLRVVTNPEEVMTITRRTLEETYQIAPEGWTTIFALANELGVDHTTLSKYVNAHGPIPMEGDEAKVYLSSHNNRALIHISPQKAQEMRQNVARRTPPPEGWQAAGAIKSTLKISTRTVGKYLGRFKDEYPTEIRTYWGITGEHRYISPELIKVLKEHHGRETSVPEGWHKVPIVAKMLGVSDSTIRRHVKGHANPSGTRNFRTEGQKSRPHLSPETITTLRAEFKKNS